MKLLFAIALKHIISRRRQSIVSVLGIVLGVGFFLAISALMRGSERDFISRLIDNFPHITVRDEYRAPRIQPAVRMYPQGVVKVYRVKPPEERRGIRQYQRSLAWLKQQRDVLLAPVLMGEALLSFAGRETGMTLSGMNPQDLASVTTVLEYLVEGTLEDLIANPNGIFIGKELAQTMSINRGDNLLLSSTSGTRRFFKVVGIFRSGRSDFDLRQAYGNLKQVQILLNRPDRINRIIVKISNPYKARALAQTIEAKLGYKALSWQEESEDLLSALTIRNIIMYTVVSAVLLVAAFGIYNIISTVVMEKQKDIAILKSMGFHASDLKQIFLFQGVVLGIIGCLLGLPFGACLMYALGQITFTPPGNTDPIQMPLDWGISQFIVASLFALFASIAAAVIPARKAALVRPIDILRGDR